MRCAAPSASATSRSPICRCRGRPRSGISAIRSTFVGSDGGGGVGGGPGISVGAALALKGSGRLPIGICGDGDFLMSVDLALDRGALPHSPPDRRRQQSLVLQRRGAPGADGDHAQPSRSTTNGSARRCSIPEIDLAALARAQGARGFGPITRADATCRRRSPRRSPRWMPAKSPWSTCASSPATAPATPAAPWRARAGRAVAPTRPHFRSLTSPRGRGA